MKIVSLDSDRIDLKDLETASSVIDKLGTPAVLENVPWKEFPYKPFVRFVVASTEKYILLKFHVREQEIKAVHKTDNEMVCEDSCVEFFISPDDSSGYYNFEFNCRGTALASYGNSRKNRQFLNREILKKIKRHYVIHDDNHWELFLAIPTEAFVHHTIPSFPGRTFKANFYKCGDLLEVPHYLSWKGIKTDRPDFHRPEFFREISFAKIPTND